MPVLPDRFLSKMRKDAASGCWTWTGAASRGTSGGTYGHLQFEKKAYKAHRFAYERLVGPIPEGYELDHLCGNTLCVNPKHLEPVEKLENMRRSKVWSYWKSKTHCCRGHEFTPENTRVEKSGKRTCRECIRVRQRERRASQKAAGP